MENDIRKLEDLLAEEMKLGRVLSEKSQQAAADFLRERGMTEARIDIALRRLQAVNNVMEATGARRAEGLIRLAVQLVPPVEIKEISIPNSEMTMLTIFASKMVELENKKWEKPEVEQPKRRGLFGRRK